MSESVRIKGGYITLRLNETSENRYSKSWNSGSVFKHSNEQYPQSP